jgi:thymidylate kinase
MSQTSEIAGPVAPNSTARAAPPFAVLLGPDFAGKSTALARLRARDPDRRILSTDEDFLAAGHRPIAELRRVAGQVIGALGTDFSPDFLVGLLHTAVVHLRDELLRAEAVHGLLLVDSYYYKFLAKCRLAGVGDNPVLAWWRSFPQPVRAVYLDVSPAAAWRRCGRGSRLNPLEHYGPRPDFERFAAYQADLSALMLEEIRHLPVTVLGERADPAQTAREIEEALADD